MRVWLLKTLGSDSALWDGPRVAQKPSLHGYSEIQDLAIHTWMYGSWALEVSTTCKSKYVPTSGVSRGGDSVCQRQTDRQLSRSSLLLGSGNKVCSCEGASSG